MPSVCAVHRRPIDIIFGKKGQHQNQDWTKSFSNLHFSTLFQIELEKENNNQNQDSTKAAIFSALFQVEFEKKQPQLKPRFYE